MYSYIHIPFCSSKCSYCRFASFTIKDSLKINFYVDYLCREIEISETIGSPLQSIYFWGGTPSTLSSEQIARIIQALKKKYGFTKNIEITLESTPENITKNSLKEWKELWVNRISMWIQSLNEATLKEIQRTPTKEIYRALEVLESWLIKNISVDFIIGLPYVKPWELKEYIQHILRYYKIIKHVSIYMLEDYYEVPEERDSRFENITYPVDWSKDGLSEVEFLEEYSDLRKYLQKKGYNSYEISNFSKQWYECRHNIAYWQHKEVAAFWLWASGFIDWVRYKNSDEFWEYYKWEGITTDEINKKDVILEKIMFWLRTNWFDQKLLRYLDKNAFEKLKMQKFLRIRKWRIMLWKKWYTLLDTIVVELLS